MMTIHTRPLGSPDTAATAAAIHRNALGSAQKRLWQAAMGTVMPDAEAKVPQNPDMEKLDLDALLELAGRATQPRPMAAVLHSPDYRSQIRDPDLRSVEASTPVMGEIALDPARLGANARHAPALERAADRTGIPATALAAIVNAEAAKDSAGQWNIYSRNSRSSAAGLGQFLSRTWEGMAETRGTWLNQTAQAKGWLDRSGQVRPAARAELLQLRYNATASIETTADYARANLKTLERSGVATGEDASAVARTAYLAHHLGPGDAIKYLKTGLTDERAGLLLRAQIGGGRASQAIARTGDASAAHRAWLDNYVGSRVRPERFA
ncbi:peptidoglycan-binding protein [Sphingomonas sp. J315]|uniref:peptidoglycan-binding protein n=2 Tax=unclassified Sphingomonas TaxID=196159 RepID=UPI0021AD8AFA|nr:peptidoglycan-binding protein [Sphingomonas sp. J315]UUX98960.1 peptidoglycan-binding protein [Sphingomonas sp. J315]